METDGERASIHAQAGLAVWLLSLTDDEVIYARALVRELHARRALGCAPCGKAAISRPRVSSKTGPLPPLA